MKAAVEPLEGNKVKLSIEVDEQEFEHDIDAAFRKISREVRIPGFRPGKAPRRILEARLGKETGRVEALRDALPHYYYQALRENDVDAVASPEIDITGGQEDGAVSFDAVVEVRPQLKLAGYDGLRVVVPSPEVKDEDVVDQIDRLRSNFGELQPVDRPAKNGDFLTIDLSGSRNGEPVEGLTTDDFLYELGSDSVLPGLDGRLHGAKLGDILSFEPDLGGTGTDADEGGGGGGDAAQKISVRVLVKDIKEKILPELTDEWASEASEFETVDELRADITERMGLVRRIQSAMTLQSAALEALVELVDIDPPASLVDVELQYRVEQLTHRLDSQGAHLRDYLQATGQTGDEVVASLRAEAVSAVKADLALRAVSEAEHIEATEEDIEAEIERLAQAAKVKVKDLRRNLERADRMGAVRSDWKKRKALEWLVDHVEIVDPEGRPVDRGMLEPPTTEGNETPQAPQAEQEGEEQ